MPLTLRDYFNKFEPIIIFDEILKRFNEYKNSFGSMLNGSHMDAQLWLNQTKPGEKINLEINKIIHQDCQSFKQFMLSSDKYENKDICKKLYQMNQDDINRLIEKTCFYEKKWSQEDSIAANYDDGIELKFSIENIDEVLREQVEELKKHVTIYHDEYFSESLLDGAKNDIVHKDHETQDLKLTGDSCDNIDSGLVKLSPDV